MSYATAYEGKKLAIMSSALNMVLTAVKFLLYIFTGSAALLAETVHSLTDVLGSLLVAGGIYLSEKKSEKFPWGLYKVESIAAVLSSGLIFLAAYGIAKMILKPVASLTNLDVGLVAVLLMALPNLFFYKYESKIAKAMNSPALMADAENWKMDTASLIVVGVGIIGAKFSYQVMDRIAAIVVLIAVVKSGYGILRNSMKSLLDASVDKGTLKKIEEVIRGFPVVREIAEVNARNSGRYIFVSVILRLSVKRLKDAHGIADDIERKIKENVPFVERVIIHYEPEKKDYTRHAVPLADRDGSVSEHFSSAPFIALWDQGPDGAVLSQDIIENPFRSLEKRKGISLAAILTEKGVDILYTKKSFEGKGPEYVLADAGIEVRRADKESLTKLMKEQDGKNNSRSNSGGA